MFKKFVLLLVLVVLAVQPVYTKKKQDKNKNERKAYEYKGNRELSLKQRITAEGRYQKLLRKIKVPQDAQDICNQLLYMENGYHDHGFFPRQKKYYQYKKIPAGFWVYVYPYWYIWGDQKLF